MDQMAPISKSKYVYKVLKELILSGELAQGERILANNIAKELGVSVIPVREALGRLQSEGLVDIELHKGARVTVFDVKKIEEVFSIRALLEGYAARTAINFIKDTELKKMKQMTIDMEQSMLLNDDQRYSEIHRAFHLVLYEHTPYTLIKKMIYNLWDGNWAKILFIVQPYWRQLANEEHKSIVKAIENKNENELEFLVRQHQLNAGKVICEHIKAMDKNTKNQINEILRDTLKFIR